MAAKVLALLIASLAIVIATFALWRPWERDDAAPAPRVATSSPAPATTPPTPDPAIPSSSVPPAAAPATVPEVSPEEAREAREAIDNLELTLRDYGLALRGNPVGTNAEITAALMGDNEKQMKLEIPAGSTLNDQGELCDPWGTPWFFHQLSATKTEIRSAGPDRVMYNEDDFVR